jgi:hypothetical protein
VGVAVGPEGVAVAGTAVTVGGGVSVGEDVADPHPAATSATRISSAASTGAKVSRDARK